MRITNEGLCGECATYIPSQLHEEGCKVGPNPTKCKWCKQIHKLRTECFHERKENERKQRKSNVSRTKGKRK